ncbi:MAG: UDP-N-acetylglucosamine 1-carboxyvinyltransferase, partial [Microgenomates group bacterium Gr01-1014_93]
MKYIIEGGRKLKGEVKISGNKNSILPCMAAALLTQEEVILKNVPNISDVDIFIEIFKYLGVNVERKDSSLYINAKKIFNKSLPENLVSKLRASILLVGPILKRTGEVNFHFPGGDIIGKRNIQTHLDGFIKLGAKIIKNDLNFHISLDRPKKKISIFMDEASVTATENLILTSVLGNGKTDIRNTASEPHIIDLCNMLNKMGGKIKGIGTDNLEITGVKKLRGAEFTIGDDFIEVATYSIAAAITKGEIKIICNTKTDLVPIINILEKFGIKLIPMKDGFLVKSGRLKSPEKVITSIWPGFPTDLMSVVIVLATQSEGVILCHDWMYESRMFFVDKLISMGADITIADPHRVLVRGPSRLNGRVLETPDIRAG